MNFESRRVEMVRSLLLIATCLWAFQTAMAVSDEPQLYYWEWRQLSETRTAMSDPTPELEQALKMLRKGADRALRNKSYSVTYNEFVPPSGDKHDYASFGAYWWPDPTKKDGLPFIRHDGKTNEAQKSLGDKNFFNEFSKDVQTLSLAYTYFDDEKYAQHAIHLLNDWFLNPETRMNPHLEYAQAVLGRNHGKNSGIIDTRDLIFVLESMELLKRSPGYTQEFSDGLRQWFGEFLDWLQTSGHGKKENLENNNHGAWYQAQVIRIALFLDDQALARGKLEHVCDNLIPEQIMADGTQPEELARTNAFHYSIFNLFALGVVARMGESLGYDLWHYQTDDGRGMQAAAVYLLPYVTGRADWPHQQISKYELSPLTNGFFRMLSVRYEEPGWLNVSDKFLERYSVYDSSPFLAAAYQENPSAN